MCSLLWKPNALSYGFSKCYDETWVEKLYRGFKRNLTAPFKFVCFTDEPREFCEPIEQEPITGKRPIGYGACIEPYRLNKPMILVGLDTVVVGNIDHLADYCVTGSKIALPLDPYAEGKVCNGVALVPAGNKDVYDSWRGQNDMDWMRSKNVALLDELFPGQIVSYKGRVRTHGLEDAVRIVYFHGRPKMNEADEYAVLAHWI